MGDPKGVSGGDLPFWVALSFIKDVGPVTVRRLLTAFPTPRAILAADRKDLMGVEGVSAARAEAIRRFRDWDLVDREIAHAADLGVSLVTWSDPRYPEPLRPIDDAPFLLYMKGTVEPADKYAVAIVGSRNMSPYGKAVAEAFGADLARKGITVVSGFARGIDTTAHQAALKGKGRSIAVLGCGIDTPYPPENAPLLDSLCDQGAAISEFPFGTPPNRENFPQRNRLISGLSLGVLIVEAARGSGSLITARCALDQGKEVFAIPGNITAANSVGANDLIKAGARPVQSADDIVRELAPLLRGLLRQEGGKKAESLAKDLDGLAITGQEKAICSVLGSEPRHIDVISRETGVAVPALSGILLGLELKGIVKQAEGKRFYLA